MGVVFDDYVQNIAHYKELRELATEKLLRDISIEEYLDLNLSVREILNREYDREIKSVILQDVTKRLNINAEQAMIEIEELDLRLIE